MSSKLVDLLQGAFTLLENRKFLIANCFNKLHGSFGRTQFPCYCLERQFESDWGSFETFAVLLMDWCCLLAFLVILIFSMSVKPVLENSLKKESVFLASSNVSVALKWCLSIKFFITPKGMCRVLQPKIPATSCYFWITVKTEHQLNCVHFNIYYSYPGNRSVNQNLGVVNS